MLLKIIWDPPADPPTNQVVKIEHPIFQTVPKLFKIQNKSHFFLYSNRLLTKKKNTIQF